MRALPVHILLVAFALSASAEITTYKKICDEQREPRACEIAELEPFIDFKQFAMKTGQYAFVTGTGYPRGMGESAKKRAQNDAHLYCAESERVWLGDYIARYSKLTGSIAVDRVAYDACMLAATENYLRRERKAQLYKAINIATIVVPILLVAAALWYRRPLARKARQILSRLNQLGPQ